MIQWRLALFALITPNLLGAIGVCGGTALQLELGSVVIQASLVASASYIAAPAAIKAAIPDADIGLAMLCSLGITFPFNVLVGIGLYHQIALFMG